jgi:hypothetical protein
MFPIIFFFKKYSSVNAISENTTESWGNINSYVVGIYTQRLCISLDYLIKS